MVEGEEERGNGLNELAFKAVDVVGAWQKTTVLFLASLVRFPIFPEQDQPVELKYPG